MTNVLETFAANGDADDAMLIARMTLPKDEGGIEINLVGGMAFTPGRDSGIATNVFGDRNVVLLFNNTRFNNTSTA